MTFGERLRECRKAKGLTQKKLGEKSGVHINTIIYYENDSIEPKLFTISCIATALGVSIDYLAGLSKYKYPNK